MIFDLSTHFGYVLIVAAVLALECLLIGFIIPGKARKQTFPKNFMIEKFGDIHQKAFHEQIKEGGYPDMGSGFYSKQLSYQSWYKFNSAQRAHLNFVEFLPSSLTFLLIAGLYFPIISASFGLAMILGRLLYAIGYFIGGPNGRLIGVLINDLMIIGLFILSIISGAYLIQQRQPTIY